MGHKLRSYLPRLIESGGMTMGIDPMEIVAQIKTKSDELTKTASEQIAAERAEWARLKERADEVTKELGGENEQD